MFITNYPAMLIRDSLVITDVHLGITRELYERGVSLPSQVKTLAARVNKLKAMTKAKQLVILGDLKHNIPGISWQERREIPEFLSLLKFRKIIITKGNHDGNIERLVDKKTVVRKSFAVGDYYLAHGHRKINTKKKIIVIGHSQPHVRFRDRFAGYVEPCWVRGRIRIGSSEKRLIVMPAFNELCGAAIVNEKPLIGPVAKNIRNAGIYLLDGTDIGKIDELKKKYKQGKTK